MKASVHQIASPTAMSVGSHQLPRILMIGAHRTKTLGGITTLIDALLKSSLAKQFKIRHLATQADEYNSWEKLWLALGALWKLIGIILWWRPEIVYIHIGANLSTYRKLPFIAISRLLQKKIIAHFHAGDFAEYYERQPRFGKWLLRTGLGKSHQIIAVSESLKRVLDELVSESEIVMIANGIPLSEFRKGNDDSSDDQNDNLVRLLFVGAMGRMKGELDLLKAVKLLIPRYPNLRLSMLGHGEIAVKQFCDESNLWPYIEHLGPVKLDERARYFHPADIFVLPSYAEGMSISIIEAMAAGLPVVATKIGGNPELIEDGKEGFLFEAGDVEELAKILARLIESPNLRYEISVRASEKSKEFDLDSVTTQLSCILQKLGSSKNSH